MDPFERVLVIDTSGKVGQMALSDGGEIVAERTLAEARRHARDLPVQIKEMLDERKWKPRDVTSLVVSIGPGSYTGLRVGIAAVKAFAYATGCEVFSIPTFDAIASSVAPGDFDLWIVADAQQGNLYAGVYRWSLETEWNESRPLTIVTASEWVKQLTPNSRIAGPAIELVRPLLSDKIALLDDARAATASALLATAKARSDKYRSNPWRIEPNYLRGSSAEEKRKAAARNAGLENPRD